MDAATVKVATHYVVAPALSVTAAALQTDKKTVVVRTGRQTDKASYKVTVSGVKEAGGTLILSTGNNATWLAVAVAPVIILNSPTSASVGAGSPSILVTFSVPMNKTAARTALSITPKATTTAAAPGWPGTFSWSGNQMKYKLSGALAPNTTYTVRVSTAAKSTAGLSLASVKTWSFKTNGAPAVASSLPRGAGVAGNTQVRIRFNQTMNKTATQQAFSLKAVGSTTPLVGIFSWWGRELCFTPSALLKTSTSYRVTLTKAAKSAGGTSLAAALSWSFKTDVPVLVPGALTATGVATARGAEIVIHLTSAAQVTVTIRNLAGRPVAALTPGQLEAGMHTLLWGGQSALGTKAPPGTYLIELVANSAEGRQARALTPLRLGR